MLGVTADLGGQFDIPGKKDPQLRNCLHQIGLAAWQGWGSVFKITIGVGGFVPKQPD